MKKRTIILAALCAVFLITDVVMCSVSGKNPVKTMNIDENPDKITVTGKDNKILLVKEGNNWFAGEDKFEALQNTVNLMIRDIKEIKVLDTVVKSKSSYDEETYELNAEKAVVVTAYKGDEVIRTITIGKTSATRTQTYISIDDSKKIYLISGDYKSEFGKSEADLYSKKIYSFDDSEITSVRVNNASGDWGFFRANSNAEWIPSGKASGMTFNQETVDKWITSISYADCENYINKNMNLPAKADSTVTITTANDEVTFNVYKFKTGESEYTATCNKNPHKFVISDYNGEKYTKNLEDLK